MEQTACHVQTIGGGVRVSSTVHSGAMGDMEKEDSERGTIAFLIKSCFTAYQRLLTAYQRPLTAYQRLLTAYPASSTSRQP